MLNVKMTIKIIKSFNISWLRIGTKHASIRYSESIWEVNMHAKSSIRSEAEIMCDALRWAAFGGVHRGQSFTYKEIRKDVWRFETEYFGKRAWVNLELPVTALSLLLAGAVVLQQLNSMSEGLV